MDINFLLFEQFETLDLFGPVEICGRHPDFQLHYISQNGGLVTSTQGVRIDTEPQRNMNTCLLYTSDAADEEDSGDIGGRRNTKKNKTKKKKNKSGFK